MKTLKKISFGAFAFILGLTLVLTQSAFKGSPLKTMKRLPVTVYYHNSDFSKAQVEDESNWSTTPNSESCDNEQEAACRLIIDSSYIVSGQLQSSANLTAAEFTNPINSQVSAYVTGSADANMERSNKTQ
ncbi:hypothetical protein [Pedobacter frigidisoli]|uniref:hypothetical protein n=1 Tax=Pedobacter frigidisoli TaxID=2530455 RepID=UPI00292E2DAA|nr:hypothetical protein [Pedobacter frigidisoli]